jgi:serine/threonine protein kinase
MDTDTFVRQLRQYDLVRSRHMERAVSEGTVQAQDARSLARALIQQNLLTPYQANQILTGKGQTLVVGKYRLIERLGPGSLGQSFKAIHVAMDRLVTLRRLVLATAADPKAQARFQRVVQILAQLTHANLPAAFDAFEEEGGAVLVMEYVEGTSLVQRVRQGGPLPIGLACHIVRQTALAVQYVHGQGLKCPHLQPSGILLAEQPGKYAGPHGLGASPPARRLIVKIVDLGLALPSADRSPANENEESIGPADFVAPEQVSSNPVVDLRTLVYRLGGILYFALTGRTPFPERHAWAQMIRHQFKDPEPVESLREEIPPLLAAVVRKMLAKQPADRYQTLTQAAADLEAFGSRDGVGVPST